MTSTSWRLRAIALALLVGLAPLTLAVVPTLATAGNDHSPDEPPTDPHDGAYSPGAPYAVTQGGTCTVVEALGDGSTSVSDAYKYRMGANSSYSAYGFYDLQENQGSQLFLYEGTDGTSLVMLHDRLDGPEGGVVTFGFDGLPSGAAAEWVVKDDYYDGPTNYDRFDVGDGTATIDWTWQAYRTDGAAFVGMEDGDYDAVTLTPGFNEDAYYWNSSVQGGTTDELTSWTLRSGDGARHALDMSAPLEIRRGTCSPDLPSATLESSTDSTEPGATVTFDASGSTDADGVAAYHWDFDGDGTTDDTTTSPTASYQYADEGEYDATVTVEDRSGQTGTASTTVSVAGDDAPVTAVVSVDVAEPRTGQELTFDASDSAGDVTEYRWSFGDDTGTTTSGPTATHTYTEPGTYTVTLETVGSDGATAETTRTVTVVGAPVPAQPPDDAKDSGPVRMAYVTDKDDESVTMRFYNPPTDDGFTGTFGFGADAVRLHALHLDPSRSVERVDATIHRLDGNPTNASVPTDATPHFYRLTGTDDGIDERTLTFSVSRETLEAVGCDPEDVTVFASTDDGWRATETTVLGSNDERVWVSAPVPDGEPFAIAAAPPVTVTVDRGTYGHLLGETVEVTATLENAGDTEWSEHVRFSVNGATANETTVSIDGGDQVTVTRTYTIDEPGIHTVGVNGETKKLLMLDPDLFATDADDS